MEAVRLTRRAFAAGTCSTKSWRVARCFTSTSLRSDTYNTTPKTLSKTVLRSMWYNNWDPPPQAANHRSAAAMPRAAVAHRTRSIRDFYQGGLGGITTPGLAPELVRSCTESN